MKRPRSRTKRWLNLTVSAGILAATSLAQADFDSMYPNAAWSMWACADWGHGNLANTAFCQTDNSSVTYYAQTSVITGTGDTNIQNFMNGTVAPTDLSVTYQYPPVYSGAGETDIIFSQRGDLGTNVLGQTVCDDAFDSLHCDQHYVFFATGTPAANLICHETGHALGLTHGSNSTSLDYTPPDCDTCFYEGGPAHGDGCVNCLNLSDTNSALGCMVTPLGASTTFGSQNTSNINYTY
jgi:hypothetical protein